jgi:hypothetical protein
MGDILLRLYPIATSGTMAPTWYVLRSKPNKEEFFWGQLIAHLIEVYYPVIRAKAVNPRAHKDKPFLPGHLFINVNLQDKPPSFFDGLPGSRGLIMDDSGPAVVPDALIAAIRCRVDQINAISGEETYGAPVDLDNLIQDCSLSDFTTIFDDCLSGNERVHRLHDLLHGEFVPENLSGAVHA